MGGRAREPTSETADGEGDCPRPPPHGSLPAASGRDTRTLPRGALFGGRSAAPGSSWGLLFRGSRAWGGGRESGVGSGKSGNCLFRGGGGGLRPGFLAELRFKMTVSPGIPPSLGFTTTNRHTDKNCQSNFFSLPSLYPLPYLSTLSSLTSFSPSLLSLSPLLYSLSHEKKKGGHPLGRTSLSLLSFYLSVTLCFSSSRLAAAPSWLPFPMGSSRCSRG